MAFNKLNIEAWEQTIYKGKEYQRVKTFRNEKKAERYAAKLEKKISSKRFPPIVERVRVGWKFGCVYRVLVPKGVKI